MERVTIARSAEGVARVKVYGKHVYGNLLNCRNLKALKDEGTLRGIIREAAIRGNMRLLDVKSWKIGPGLSAIAIVLESHITVHTWPEYKFATVDVYSCGVHTKPQKAFDFIVAQLRPEEVEYGEIKRSLE